MKNKLSIILILSIIILICNCHTVNAVTSASGGSVDSGAEISITISSSVNLQGYTVSVTDSAGCEFKSVSVPSGVMGEPRGTTIGGVSISGTKTLAFYKFTAPTVTQDTQCSIKFSVIGILDENDKILDNENITATITVKASNVSTPEPPATEQNPPATQPDTPAKKSSEARLGNLGIKPNDFNGFRKNKMSYDVQVPNDVDKVEIYAVPVDPKANVQGTGNVDLKVGVNKFEITVTAEDGTTKKVYTLTVIRETSNVVQEPATPTLGLSQLTVKEFRLSPKFETDTYEYTIGVTKDISSLELEAIANDENATVEIIGNEDLKQGENIITILVHYPDSEEVATYQIIVNKNVIVPSAVGKVDWLKPSTWGTREKIIVAIVVVLALVIIVAVVMKIRLAKLAEDGYDLPGGDELDRALTEHQELSDEEYDEYEEEDDDDDENSYLDRDAEYDDAAVYLKSSKNNFETETANLETATANLENVYADEPEEYVEGYSKRKGKHF